MLITAIILAGTLDFSRAYYGTSIQLRRLRILCGQSSATRYISRRHGSKHINPRLILNLPNSVAHVQTFKFDAQTSVQDDHHGTFSIRALRRARCPLSITWTLASRRPSVHHL
jgi:hypothetical protein